MVIFRLTKNCQMNNKIPINNNILYFKVLEAISFKILYKFFNILPYFTTKYHTKQSQWFKIPLNVKLINFNDLFKHL